MEGWIKLHRKLLTNPIVCKDCETFSIWIYLLLNATHKDIDVLFNGGKIILRPGQLITSRKSIAHYFKISESKVHRALKLLENEQQIEQQTNRHNRLISIVNWTQYQQSEQQIEQVMNNKRTTNEQLMNTNNNIKNNNNVVYFSYNKKAEHDFEEFTEGDEFDLYIKKHGVANKNDFYKLSNDKQEKLRENFIMNR